MLILYEHPFALYCQKVLVAFNELGVEYDVLEEQRDFSRADLAKLWPPASIPVLRDGDQVIGETSIIIEHVGGARVLPSLQARLWDRICDQYISDAVQAIVAARSKSASTSARCSGRSNSSIWRTECSRRSSPHTNSSPARRSRSPTAPPHRASSTRWRFILGTRVLIRT